MKKQIFNACSYLQQYYRLAPRCSELFKVIFNRNSGPKFTFPSAIHCKWINAYVNRWPYSEVESLHNSLYVCTSANAKKAQYTSSHVPHMNHKRHVISVKNARHNQYKRFKIHEAIKSVMIVLKLDIHSRHCLRHVVLKSLMRRLCTSLYLFRYMLSIEFMRLALWVSPISLDSHL